MKYLYKFNGKKISVLSLGLMNNIQPENEKDQLKLYVKAFENGINSLDTAPNYQNGYSDIFLGKLLKILPRDELFLSSKVFFKNNYSKIDQSLHPTHIKDSVLGTLKNLNTSYIDTLILHRFDSKTPIEKTLNCINELLKEGLIKSWGISAFTIEQILDFYYQAKIMDIPLPLFGQYAYNLFNKDIEKELHDVFKNKAIKIFSYYPLAQGVLTGKYTNSLKGVRAVDKIYKKSMWDLNKQKIDIANKYVEYCKKNEINPIAFAYLWCLRNENVCSVITNIRNEKQLFQNIDGIDRNYNFKEFGNIEEIFENKPIKQYFNTVYEIDQRSL